MGDYYIPYSYPKPEITNYRFLSVPPSHEALVTVNKNSQRVSHGITAPKVSTYWAFPEVLTLYVSCRVGEAV